MLSSGHIHPLQRNDNRRRGRRPLLREYIPMVWPTRQGHLRQRPSIHVPILESALFQIGNNSERVDCLPPPNGRADRTKEPMGRAVLADNHDASAKRLGEMAPFGDCGAQQSNQLHDESPSKRGPARLSPSFGLPMGTRDRDPTGGRTSRNNQTTTGTSENGTQSGGRENTGGSVPPERESLARRQESSPAISDAQIGPQTSWPVPDHGASFTRGLPTRPSPDLDHP